MKFLTYVLVAIITSAVTAYVITGGNFVGPSQVPGAPKLDLTYSDFVSIMLTALGLILAALVFRSKQMIPIGRI